MHRHIFSLYFYSGLTVAVGVIAVGLLGYLFAGAPLAAGLAMGAICVSINDVPTSARHKVYELSAGLLAGTLVTFLVGIARADPRWLGVAIAAVSFAAAMVTAYGKKAMPLSFSLFFTMVLTLGLPPQDLAGVIRHSAEFAAGAAVYLLYSLLVARRLHFRTRQQALGECLQALADYLRVQADFFDPAVALDDCYRALIGQQAVVAEKLQAARDLVFRQLHSRRDGSLASVLAAALELFEQLLSAHTDYAILRQRHAGSDLLLFFRDLSLKGRRDLEEIGIALMRDAAPRSTVTYKAETYAIEYELARLRREAGNRAEERQALAALVGVHDKTLHGIEQIEQLRRAAATPITPGEALKGVDVEPFLSRPSYSLRLLAGHLTLASTILRYALRVSLAMSCGYGLARVLPYATHGYWILLTVAVIMRSSFSLTRQRHGDRVVGNLIGCLLAAFLLWATANPALLVAAMFVAVAIAHAYATVNYRYTAVASCVMGLLAVRFLDPAAQFLVAERVLDTVVGGLIAYAFSFVLPNWEYTSMPRLVADVEKAAAAYARASLQPAPAALEYRLARKQMMDAIAALGGASRRMLAEPPSRHRAVAPLNDFITASYLMAAQLASVRILLQRRGAELDMERSAALMAATAAGRGDPGGADATPAAEGSAQGILQRRLAIIAEAAREIGGLAGAIRTASA